MSWWCKISTFRGNFSGTHLILSLALFVLSFNSTSSYFSVKLWMFLGQFLLATHSTYQSLCLENKTFSYISLCIFFHNFLLCALEDDCLGIMLCMCVIPLQSVHVLDLHLPVTCPPTTSSRIHSNQSLGEAGTWYVCNYPRPNHLWTHDHQPCVCV